MIRFIGRRLATALVLAAGGLAWLGWEEIHRPTTSRMEVGGGRAEPGSRDDRVPGPVTVRNDRAPSGPRQPLPGRQILKARVVDVPDGDSLRVEVRGREERVRLEGIDAPENGQPYGEEAKRATRRLALDQTVEIHTRERDPYGRIVGIVYLPDGQELNRELIRTGNAWWYERHSDDRSLGELERAARRARIGLWSERDPVPPWRWRSTHRPSDSRRNAPNSR